MLISKKIILAPFIIVLAACTTVPQKPSITTIGDYTYTKEYISWLIEQEMSDSNVTGLSIALVDDQKIVWEQGFGYADIKANIKATPDTIYQMGSVAKVFTATAAMQLAERGMLDIDKPLKSYLPDFSIKSRFGDINEITPRNIMTHHSGLPCNWVHGMSERRPGPFLDVVTAVKDEYTAYPPNYVFAYSNLGVTLLGAAIGRVSGEKYDDYMNRHLLEPLSMSHSSFSLNNTSKSYTNGNEIEVIPLRDLPSGGLSSSATDISHFIQMYFGNGIYNAKQIISKDSLNQMFRVQNENIPLDFDFKMGLGWMLSGLNISNAGTVASHGGTTLNFHSILAILPEHKLGVVILSNSTTAQSMVQKVAEETLKLALETKSGIRQIPLRVETIKNAPITKRDITAYEGYFDTLVGLVKVTSNGNNLVAEIMGQKLELISHADKGFGVHFKLFGFIPVKIAMLDEISLSLHNIDGHSVLSMRSNGQSILLGEKIVPVKVPSKLLNYVGSYEITNKHDGPLPDSVRIAYEDGLLIGAFTFPQEPGFVFRSALLPVSDNELVMTGLGAGKGETIHLKMSGFETEVSFSGFQFKKIHDTKS